ncbi:unnamed protein product [Spirodela intermedia]|uniref:Uncharacterized protein n=1 Tax=Spirodela intermedia TaxID=51605 RepID=A0A7I8L9N8_SPIIN|nr:unnamed protein product [Spirodela intermedia]
MGTEVLIPYDVLSNQRLGFDASPAAAALFPHRKRATGGGSSANPRPRRKPDQRKRREPAVAAAPLRRGGSLDSKVGGKEEKKPGILSSAGGGDLMVFGTGRLGPEPAVVPRQIRLVGTAEHRRRGETYAGPAFSASPSPRALPLPTFPSKKPDAATRDLRRLLRLDQ